MNSPAGRTGGPPKLWPRFSSPYGLKTKLVDGDVLTEVPWSENPASYSNADTHQPPPPTDAISRRGLVTATGAGIGLLVVTTVGQTLSPLEPIGLLAVRQPSTGPQGLPVNRTADQAGVRLLATAPDWHLDVDGPRPYRLSLAEVEAMATEEADFPISCVEGWSVGAHWQGIPLLEVVRRAGGDAGSSIHLVSLQPRGSFNHSTIAGPQLSAALLATRLNGERLNVDTPGHDGRSGSTCHVADTPGCPVRVPGRTLIRPGTDTNRSPRWPRCAATSQSIAPPTRCGPRSVIPSRRTGRHPCGTGQRCRHGRAPRSINEGNRAAMDGPARDTARGRTQRPTSSRRTFDG
ncbi:MAG: molybdopterin-dependent oxidoreductase [Actinomycetota bacterium]|nr:molybdopterin-dependent oxidoreductase [Actinomycetota bacterium]